VSILFFDEYSRMEKAFGLNQQAYNYTQLFVIDGSRSSREIPGYDDEMKYINEVILSGSKTHESMYGRKV